MIKSKIVKEILAINNLDKTIIVSICGAADLGKSYLSKEIYGSLSELKLKVAHLTLDSYMVDRKVRKEKGLSGYQVESYDMDKILNDLIALKSGKSIEFYPYDHKRGKTISNSLKINASDIVIFDGLHSMHSSFLSHIDLTFFVYTYYEHLKIIRREADLIKRNYTIDFSKSISETEFNLYKKNVEPYMDRADYLILLESKWNYKLLPKDCISENR